MMVATWFGLVKAVLECLSYAVNMFGLISIAVSIRQLKRSAEQERKQDEHYLVENSITVLHRFVEVIIPEIEYKQKKLDVEIKKQSDKVIAQINKAIPTSDKITELPADSRLRNYIIIIAKSNCKFAKIFNEFEEISVYMNYNLVKDDLVYTAIHYVFCNFIDCNFEYLDYLMNSDVPYFNVLTLYYSWNDKKLEPKDKFEEN